MLPVKVAPKAARTAVVGWHGDVLKLSVTAAPENGRANDAVIALLAEVLGCPRSALTVQRGATSPRKWVAIRGLDEGEVLSRLPPPCS
jgi:uncharacterized protein YggU (UPF0235/DUF167 family)